MKKIFILLALLLSFTSLQAQVPDVFPDGIILGDNATGYRAGQLRFNSGELQVYNGTAWVAIGGGSTEWNTITGDQTDVNLIGFTDGQDGGLDDFVSRTASEANNWQSITYGNGLFVAVAATGTNRVMTSPDGVTWTARSATGDDNIWTSVTYGNGLFVAVADDGTNRVMTAELLAETRFENTVNEYQVNGVTVEPVNKVLNIEVLVDSERTTASISGSTNIDWVVNDTKDYTLTGPTTFVDVNLPTGTDTAIKEFVVRGDFALTLSADWVPYPSNDDYDGTADNHIIVTVINGNSASEIIFYSLTNI